MLSLFKHLVHSRVGASCLWTVLKWFQSSLILSDLATPLILLGWVFLSSTWGRILNVSGFSHPGSLCAMYWFQVRSLKKFFFDFFTIDGAISARRVSRSLQKKKPSPTSCGFSGCLKIKSTWPWYYTYPWNLMIMVDGLMYLLAWWVPPDSSEHGTKLGNTKLSKGSLVSVYVGSF